MENLQLHNQDNPCQQKSTSDRKFVIFDLDGTLIDSFECVLRCVNKALDSFSLLHIEISKYDNHKDIAIIFEKARLIINNNVSYHDFKKRFDNIHLDDCIDSVIIKRHVLSKLTCHYDDGDIVIILTNKYQPIAEKICNVLFRQFKLTILGRKSSKDIIPKGDNLREFIINSRLNPSQIICYYGDSEIDRLIADEFKIRFCHI